MSYYFIAPTDEDAIGANQIPGGPFPGNNRYESINECDVLASPHLWQFTAIARNVLYEDHTSELCLIWPTSVDTETQADGLVEQFIQRLPDTLRDELGHIAVTPAIATAWAECVWGMDPAQAKHYIEDLVHLAARAVGEGKHIYWWSSL
jgi:hypothetical protein